MPTQDWEIKAPSNYVYTPDELAQIGRAVQAFQATLPHADSRRVLHLVTLHGVGIYSRSGSSELVAVQR